VIKAVKGYLPALRGRLLTKQIVFLHGEYEQPFYAQEIISDR
jgi:hypothetical protein